MFLNRYRIFLFVPRSTSQDCWWLEVKEMAALQNFGGQMLAKVDSFGVKKNTFRNVTIFINLNFVQDPACLVLFHQYQFPHW